MPTNRELATLIILGAVVAWVISQPGLRRSGGQVLKAVFQWKLQLIFWLYVVYVAGVIWIAGLLGVWTVAILKDSLFWVFFNGLPILFRSHTVTDGSQFARRTIVATFAVSAFITFYVNLYSFNLAVEIIFQVAVAMLVILEVVAGHRGDEAKPVLNVVRLLLTAAGVLLIWATAVWLIDSWQTLKYGEVAMSLGMGLWLPVCLIPFIYIVAFVMHCESVFRLVRHISGRKRLALNVAIGFLLGVRFSAKLAGNFTGQWRIRLAHAGSFKEVSDVMSDYRQNLQVKAHPADP